MTYFFAISRTGRAGVQAEGSTIFSSFRAALSSLAYRAALFIALIPIGLQAHASNSAVYVSQSVPTSMVTGGVYNATVTLTNNGTTTWTSAGQYFLGSQNPENNWFWNNGRVALPSSIAPGAQATFSFPVTAPSTPATYNFQWQMVQEGQEWFGPYTPSVPVTVKGTNNSQLMSVSVPSAMTQGMSYPVTITVKNTGTTTWPAGAIYLLGSLNPQDTTLWGPNRVNVNATIAPNAHYTFSFNVTAPAPGSYNMMWRMVEEHQEWFGQASSSLVTVSAVPSAPTVSVTRTPSPMTAGQAFTLSWSSQNATSVSRTCTSSGTGYTVNDSPGLNGTTTGTASAAWVNYPSTCTWTATGAGGSASFTETMVTNAAPAVSEVTYIHTDGLGSPVARTNASGALISRTRYEPYGLTASGATPTIGFTGHVNDGETGLVYMQQRYYDPVAGRFLSIDPVTTDANTGSSFNRYAYANNSPYRYIDPDGRSPDNAADRFVVDVLKWFGDRPNLVRGLEAAAVAANLSAPGAAGASAEAAIAGGVGVKAAAQVAKVAAPTEAQAKNIQRFTSKLPANAKDSVTIKSLPNGGVAAQGVSPGNVRGSSALYEKQIDSAGKTIQFTKTTTAPDGAIVHVKDKITGNEVTP